MILVFSFLIQAFLNQHCGELVAVCEAYLASIILSETGSQNLNEELMVRISPLFTFISYQNTSDGCFFKMCVENRFKALRPQKKQVQQHLVVWITTIKCLVSLILIVLVSWNKSSDNYVTLYIKIII